MFTSAEKKASEKALIAWSAAAAGCLLFTTVYNHFGHGVHSAYMNLLLLWPLAAAVFRMICLFAHFVPDEAVCNALFGAAVTFGLGSVLRGVFEIAGTSSDYTFLFFVIGGIWSALFAVFLFGQLAKRRRSCGTAA